MAKSASYTTIQDGDVVLEWGDDTDHTFNFNANGAATDETSVLSFVVNPVPDGSNGDIRLELSINGTAVADVAFTTAQGRPWQEIVQGGVLKDGSNKLSAKLTDSDKAGSITLKDVYLMYKLAA